MLTQNGLINHIAQSGLIIPFLGIEHMVGVENRQLQLRVRQHRRACGAAPAEFSHAARGTAFRPVNQGADAQGLAVSFQL